VVVSWQAQTDRRSGVGVSALVPTDVAGIYELLNDTDNTCEAAGVASYRTLRVDLTPDLDGVITNGNGNGKRSPSTEPPATELSPTQHGTISSGARGDLDEAAAEGA